jgi:hypothetical protein
MGKQEKTGYHSKSENLSDRALTDLAIAKIIASIQRDPRQGKQYNADPSEMKIDANGSAISGFDSLEEMIPKGRMGTSLLGVQQ